jgi:uncharacterized LabA/DUF88 family protein
LQFFWRYVKITTGGKKMPTGQNSSTRNRTLILVDEGNLTGICSKLNRSIDWVKLREFLSKDKEVIEVFVYAGLPPMSPEWLEFRQKRERFLHWLEAEGFYVVRKYGRPTTAQAYKANVDVMMAAEAMELAIEVKPDIVTLVTGDGDFGFLACKMRRRGIKVEVAAFESNLGEDLKISSNRVIDLNRIVKTFEPQKPPPEDRSSVLANTDVLAS